MGNLRKLRVYAKFAKRETTRHLINPEISLTGKWLKAAGFAVGQQIFVAAENGRLVITGKEARP